MEETHAGRGIHAELYLAPSRKCINESRACNLAEYGFMFSIDTRLSARNVMKAYNMYGGGKTLGIKFMTLRVWENFFFFRLDTFPP